MHTTEEIVKEIKSLMNIVPRSETHADYLEGNVTALFWVVAQDINDPHLIRQILNYEPTKHIDQYTGGN